ncbi:MAG: hypothetical protein ACFFEL_00535 [Candidatus Thorarchaeota archaeon]
MTEIRDQIKAKVKTRYFIRESLSKRALLYRSPIVLILIYYVWILISAWNMFDLWGWSLEEGLIWSSGGPGSFIPIPSEPGQMTVVTPGSMIDHIFYLIFIHYGLWILWISLGILYLFSPYRLERIVSCTLLKWLIITEVGFFLTGRLVVTNMHPWGLQVSVSAIGLMLVATLIIRLFVCRRRSFEHRATS